MPSRNINLLLVMLMVLAIALLPACSSDDDGTTDPGPVPTEDEARASLEDAIYEMMNDPDIENPADVDFTEAHDMFSRIVADDPENMDARLGLAVSGVMAVMADQQVNDTFHAWEDYLENFTPFEAESGFMRPLGIAISPAPTSGSLDLPFQVLGTTMLAGVQPELKAVDPTIGAVQDVLHDVVIPALEEAATQLAQVAADPGFVFIISPRMQGDLEADPLEFDGTDAYALRAGVLLLTAVCRTAVTYDLSFATHDAVGLTAALDRETGNFLRLRSDGATQLGQAEADFLDAVDAIDDAIDSLLDEDDSQHDDLIVTGPDSFSEQELRDFQDGELVEAREFFTEGLVLTEDWDDDWQTPPVDLRVSAHDFFQDPVADWKQLLPPYSVIAAIGDDYAGWFYDDFITYTNIVMPEAGYASAWYDIGFDGEEVIWVYGSGHEVLEAAIEAAFDEILDQITGSPEYEGGFIYIYISMNDEYVAGLNADAEIYVSYNHERFDQFYVPQFTWQADDFFAWQAQWTNHTLNGLLPEMSSAAELMSTFGFGPDDWQQEWIIEWYDVDIDIDDIDLD